MALCARNAHITVYDVTTWSWVNLVNPWPKVGEVTQKIFRREKRAGNWTPLSKFLDPPLLRSVSNNLAVSETWSLRTL